MKSFFDVINVFEKKLIFLIAASFFAYLALFYYYVFFNPHVLYSNYSDTSYYISIAQSLYAGTGLNDATSIPHSSIISSQNGIVFIGYLLLMAGIHENPSLFSALAAVNLISLIITLILIYKIAGCLKLDKIFSLLIVVNFGLMSNVFPVLIAPINDGIALTLSLFCLYMGIKNHDSEKLWLYLFVFIASMIAIHFRLQTLLIPASCALASLFVKRYKSFFTYSFITLASSLFIYLTYNSLIYDGAGMFKAIDYYLANINFEMLTKIIADSGQGISVLFLEFGEGGGFGLVKFFFPISIVLTLIIVFYCLKNILKREFEVTLISLVILTTLALFVITPWKATRYIFIALPLLMIIVGASIAGPRSKLLLMRLYSAYFIYTIVILAVRLGFIYPPYLEQQKEAVKLLPMFVDGTPLLSENRRFSYMVFDTASLENYFVADRESDFLIYGSHEFILKGIAQMESKFHKVSITQYNNHVMGAGGSVDLAHVAITE
jgi:hypothetical protein